MQKHTKIYMKAMDFEIGDYIGCEVCQSPCVDIHHITGRGKNKNILSNLIGLCRRCHDLCHQDKKYNKLAQDIHLKNIK